MRMAGALVSAPCELLSLHDTDYQLLGLTSQEFSKDIKRLAQKNRESAAKNERSRGSASSNHKKSRSKDNLSLGKGEHTNLKTFSECDKGSGGSYRNDLEAPNPALLGSSVDRSVDKSMSRVARSSNDDGFLGKVDSNAATDANLPNQPNIPCPV